MALNTVTIQGKVLLPDGSAAAGVLIISLTDGGTTKITGIAIDGSTAQKIVAPLVVPLDVDGSFTLELVPPEEIDPPDTVYLFEYELTVGSPARQWRRQELLNLEGLSGVVDIGDIEVIATYAGVPTITRLTAKSMTVTDISTVVASPGLLGVAIFEDPGAGQETISYRIHRTAAGAYVAVVDLAGASAEGRATTEPVESEGNIGRVLQIDDGGETYSIQGHRDSGGNPVWLVTSAGGS